MHESIKLVKKHTYQYKLYSGLKKGAGRIISNHEFTTFYNTFKYLKQSTNGLGITNTENANFIFSY